MKEKFNEKRYKLIAENIIGRKVLIMGSAQGELNLYRKKNQRFFGIDLVENENVDFSWDLNTFPYPNLGKFDTIIASEILDHMDSPLMFLKECYNVLKPNGRIIITVPNMYGLMYLLGAWTNDASNKYEQHIYAWDSVLLKTLMERAGFKILKLKTLTAYWHRNIFLRFISDSVKRLSTHLMAVGIK